MYREMRKTKFCSKKQKQLLEYSRQTKTKLQELSKSTESGKSTIFRSFFKKS